MLYRQEKVKKHAVCHNSMQLSLSLCIRGFQSHHSNTEIHIHSVLHPVDVTDGKSDPQRIPVIQCKSLFKLKASLLVIND